MKAVHTIRSIYGEETKLLLKSIILSHLQYPTLLLTGITSNLIDTLNQQVNLALKICFYRKKYDSSNDLRERYQMLPFRATHDIRAACYFWKWQNENSLFSIEEMPTSKVKVNIRTKELTLQLFLRFSSDEKLFFQPNCTYLE